MTEEEKIKYWLSLQPKNVSKEMSVCSREDVGPLYRIDTQPPAVFTPRMPMSAGSSENTSVPRICASDCILGCMIGYNIGRMAISHIDGKINIKGYEKFVGGWVVSELEYEQCVKPKKKLVMDAEDTGEYWLVGYAKEMASVKPKTVGKFFFERVQYVSPVEAGMDEPFPIIVIYAEITRDDGVAFTKERVLEKGCYEITLTPHKNDRLTLYSANKDHDIRIVPIGDGEFKKRKSQACAMLTYTPPVSADWY